MSQYATRSSSGRQQPAQPAAVRVAERHRCARRQHVHGDRQTRERKRDHHVPQRVRQRAAALEAEQEHANRAKQHGHEHPRRVHRQRRRHIVVGRGPAPLDAEQRDAHRRKHEAERGRQVDGVRVEAVRRQARDRDAHDDRRQLEPVVHEHVARHERPLCLACGDRVRVICTRHARTPAAGTAGSRPEWQPVDGAPLVQRLEDLRGGKHDERGREVVGGPRLLKRQAEAVVGHAADVVRRAHDRRKDDKHVGRELPEAEEERDGQQKSEVARHREALETRRLEAQAREKCVFGRVARGFQVH